MTRALLIGVMGIALQFSSCRLVARLADLPGTGPRQAKADPVKSGSVKSDPAGSSAMKSDSTQSDSVTSASAAKPESIGVSDSTAAAHKSPLPNPDLGYNAREGRTLYRHYCLFCHGDTGGGDGFNAYNLDPRPRDLSDSTFQGTHSDDDLAAAIRSGGGAVGLSTGMPPWGRTLSERSISNLVEYLRSLKSKKAEP